MAGFPAKPIKSNKTYKSLAKTRAPEIVVSVKFQACVHFLFDFLKFNLQHAGGELRKLVNVGSQTLKDKLGIEIMCE